MMTGYAASKGTPFPSLAVLGSGMMIMLGGLGVIFGQYIQISLALIAFFLLAITPVMHNFWKETDPNKKMDLWSYRHGLIIEELEEITEEN